MFLKFKKIHWIFCHSATLICHSAVTQLLLNTAPPKMALESLLRVLWHFWRYVECFSEFSESTGMRFEAFWRRSGDFFETSTKSVLNFEICRNFYLRLVSSHGEASDRPKIGGFAQNALKVFWGVFSTQTEPETYLQRYRTTIIDVSKVFLKLKKIHWIFVTQLLWFVTQLSLSFCSTQHLLKWP